MTIATIKPIVENQFWTEESFARTGVVVHEQLEVRAPVDLTILVQARPGLDIPLVQRI